MNYVDPRLSDLSIEDHIWRAQLYTKILNYVRTSKDSIFYELKEDEKTRPDLVSYRVYGVESLRWVVVLVAGNDDEFSPLPVGYRLVFPPISEVRRMIREVKEDYAKASI